MVPAGDMRWSATALKSVKKPGMENLIERRSIAHSITGIHTGSTIISGKAGSSSIVSGFTGI